jgi:hypothetical protein
MAFFFKDLIVWREAKSLAVDVYDLSDRFPREKFSALHRRFAEQQSRFRQT